MKIKRHSVRVGSMCLNMTEEDILQSIKNLAEKVIELNPEKYMTSDFSLKSYRLICPEYCDNDPKCPACNGKGYNVTSFKDGQRI